MEPTLAILASPIVKCICCWDQKEGGGGDTMAAFHGLEAA